MKSIFLMGDKKVFKLKELDIKGLADSLGLASTPEVKILDTSGDAEEEIGRKTKLEKLKDKIKEKKKQKAQTAEKESVRRAVTESEEDDFLIRKKVERVEIEELKEDENQFEEVGKERVHKLFKDKEEHYANI